MSLEHRYRRRRDERIANREVVAKIMDMMFTAMNDMTDDQRKHALTALITEIQMALAGADKP